MMQSFEEQKRKFWIFASLNEENLIEHWAKQTYETYQNDVYAMAALITTLNHKCWFYYEKGQEKLAKIYADLYYKYNDLEWDWLEAYGTEEEKTWYFETLD